MTQVEAYRYILDGNVLLFEEGTLFDLDGDGVPSRCALEPNMVETDMRAQGYIFKFGEGDAYWEICEVNSVGLLSLDGRTMQLFLRKAAPLDAYWSDEDEATQIYLIRSGELEDIGQLSCDWKDFMRQDGVWTGEKSWNYTVLKLSYEIKNQFDGNRILRSMDTQLSLEQFPEILTLTSRVEAYLADAPEETVVCRRGDKVRLLAAEVLNPNECLYGTADDYGECRYRMLLEKETTKERFWLYGEGINIYNDRKEQIEYYEGIDGFFAEIGPSLP